VTVNVVEAEPTHDRVDVPVAPRVMLVGARVQLMPVVGVVEAVRSTVPANPFTGLIVTVDLPVAPALAVIVVGDGTVRLKS